PAPISLQHYYTSYIFNSPAPTQIYTLSLHDALPISSPSRGRGRAPRLGADVGRAPRGVLARPLVQVQVEARGLRAGGPACARPPDRKSTRLNSSHVAISYAVFCLKKKKTIYMTSLVH